MKPLAAGALAVFGLVLATSCAAFLALHAVLPHSDTTVPAEELRRAIRLVMLLGGIGTGLAALLAILLIRQQRRLEKALGFQERVVAIVGHDLRSPVSAILTATEYLLRRDVLEPSVRRMVERVQRSGRRIEGLTGLLTDFTRARVGTGIPLYPQRMDLHELAENVVDEFREQTQRELILTCEGNAIGRWDPDRVAQILCNLIQNAVRHGAPGTTIRVESRDLGDRVCFSVRNHGPVIPRHLRGKIFDPFKRGDQNDGSVRLSLGLGLYIVHALVVAHEGEISFTSSPEEGTCFQVVLPRRLSRDREIAPESRGTPLVH